MRRRQTEDAPRPQLPDHDAPFDEWTQRMPNPDALPL
jgi:hypothetical protein